MFKFERGTCGTLTVTHAAREPQDTLDLFFTNGSIHIPFLNEGKMKLLTKDGERTETHPNHANIHQPMIEDFARAVLENRDPLVAGEIGRAVASIEEEIYK
jgi:predicted dehydrogenase